MSQHGVTSNQSKTRDAGSGALRGIHKNAEQSCLECNNTRKQPFQQSEDALFCIKEARDRLHLRSRGLQMEIMSRSDICQSIDSRQDKSRNKAVFIPFTQNYVILQPTAYVTPIQTKNSIPSYAAMSIGNIFEQAAHLMTGLLPRSKCGTYREPDRETIRINTPNVDLPQISCGAHVLGGVAAVKNTESVQARPIANPRKLSCVFHCRFAAKSRIETNFNRVYLSNGWAYSAEIL